jgi:hypothetical protein
MRKTSTRTASAATGQIMVESSAGGAARRSLERASGGSVGGQPHIVRNPPFGWLSRGPCLPNLREPVEPGGHAGKPQGRFDAPLTEEGPSP